MCKNYATISVKGNVVLVGSVTMLTGKQRVGVIAEAIVGAGKVDNQLAIK